MTPTLRAHFADYASFHGAAGNKACHYVGIPLIVLALLALLARVPLFAVGGFTVTLAEVALVVVTAYYLTLDAVMVWVLCKLACVRPRRHYYYPPNRTAFCHIDPNAARVSDSERGIRLSFAV